MFVLCSLKIEAQWSEPMSFTFHSALRKLIQTEPSIGASHQSSAHLAKQFVSEKKIVRNRPIRKKNFLWRPCLSTDRNEKCNLYRRPSIVASYQVSVHMAKQFERRRFDKIGQLETRIVCGDHVC
jgi:3-methyladenine DNA glycosylase Tag